MKKLLAATLILALFAPAAHAIPELQIYIEGATYDDLDETWVISSTETIRLWAVGDVGGKGTISDVKLAIAYEGIYNPTFSLTSTTTGGYNGFTDPTTPEAALYNKTVTDGSTPVLSSGKALPAHGVYGDGTTWQEWFLGDFTEHTYAIADFSGITDTPIPNAAHSGQINVYELSTMGMDLGASIHFDLYNSYWSPNPGAKAVFAPFSHDGSATTVPEPGTLALLGLGLAGLGARLRRKQ